MKTDSQLSDHVVVLGYGSAGRRIIRPLVASGLRIVVIDQEQAHRHGEEPASRETEPYFCANTRTCAR